MSRKIESRRLFNDPTANKGIFLAMGGKLPEERDKIRLDFSQFPNRPGSERFFSEPCKPSRKRFNGHPKTESPTLTKEQRTNQLARLQEAYESGRLAKSFYDIAVKALTENTVDRNK